MKYIMQSSQKSCTRDQCTDSLYYAYKTGDNSKQTIISYTNGWFLQSVTITTYLPDVSPSAIKLWHSS